ncbi:MAG: DUF1109 family protein [Pelagibacterales bacterium]|jgi:hypothetical protein|nr:DUF1109 family protein [Pelagibacterales bacterium]MBT4108515.1 DUF1109 family protein [Pelagibacterales bacterium]
MTTTTDDLISQLTRNLPPVTRLGHPLKRLLKWFMVALPLSLLLGALVDQQHLSMARKSVQDLRFFVDFGIIFTTALTAGYATLSSAQPGRSQYIWLLPVLPFLIWLSLIGESCIQLIDQIGSTQFSLIPHWSCYSSVIATGFVPALLMVVMLKRSAVLRLSHTILLGTLATSALGAIGLHLYHPSDVTAVLLLWQFITMVMLLGLARLISNYMSNRRV